MTEALTTAQPETVVTLIERLATDPKVDVDKLEKLLQLQREWKADEARLAFTAAFSAMQAELPSIDKDGQGQSGAYSTFAHIQERIKPILATHGFTLAFRNEWPDGKLCVVTILRHAGGHEETTSFLTEKDPSGNKNTIQGWGSAQSYGQRYGTLGILNIVSGGDDDGSGAGTDEPVEPKGPAPDGYDDWEIAIREDAADGLKSLGAAWKGSPRHYRDYFGIEQWESLKRQAAAVGS